MGDTPESGSNIMVFMCRKGINMNTNEGQGPKVYISESDVIPPGTYQMGILGEECLEPIFAGSITEPADSWATTGWLQNKAKEGDAGTYYYVINPNDKQLFGELWGFEL